MIGAGNGWRGFGIALALAAASLAGCVAPMPEPIPLPGTAPLPGKPGAAAPVRLAGSSWYWLGTVTAAGIVVPRDPGDFNLEFLDGGQMAAQVDCNRGGATWKQDGRALKIGPLSSTRAMCAAGSEAERFGRQLALVRGAQVSTGLLEFDLGEAGAMLFARDPDWRLRNFDCPNGSPVLVAFGREQAIVRWRGEAWDMKQQVGASGSRYGSGNAILFSKGNEATLVNAGRQVAGPCIAKR
jgi:heat shock protein HslJ